MTDEEVIRIFYNTLCPDGDWFRHSDGYFMARPKPRTIYYELNIKDIAFMKQAINFEKHLNLKKLQDKI